MTCFDCKREQPPSASDKRRGKCRIFNWDGGSFYGKLPTLPSIAGTTDYTQHLWDWVIWGSRCCWADQVFYFILFSISNRNTKYDCFRKKTCKFRFHTLHNNATWGCIGLSNSLQSSLICFSFVPLYRYVIFPNPSTYCKCWCFGCLLNTLV